MLRLKAIKKNLNGSIAANSLLEKIVRKTGTYLVYVSTLNGQKFHYISMITQDGLHFECLALARPQNSEHFPLITSKGVTFVSCFFPE